MARSAAWPVDLPHSLYVVFCEQATTADAEKWKELAQIAEGRFATIALHAATSVVSTPVDREMALLGSKRNATYVALSAEGEAGLADQASQDRRRS